MVNNKKQVFWLDEVGCTVYEDTKRVLNIQGNTRPTHRDCSRLWRNLLDTYIKRTKNLRDSF